MAEIKKKKENEKLVDLVMCVTGLKCDARNCDFRKDDISFDNYYKWIEQSCPKCGASLLTFEDYNKLERVKNIFNKIDCRFTRFIAKIFKNKKIKKLEMNGTGRIFIEGSDKEVFKEQ